MKYITLKDLPGIPVGTILEGRPYVFTNEGEVSISYAKENPDFFQEIKEQEAKMAKLIRELSTRTDKWLPEKGEKYYNHQCIKNIWSEYATEKLMYNFGFIFRDIKEYNKYITKEAKDLLFNL